MAISYNMVVDAGTSFTSTLTIQNEDNTAVDLTGMTAYSQMRKSYYTNTFIDIPVSVVTPEVDGQIQIDFIPATTDQIRPGRYVYDIEIRNASGTVVNRVVQGIITVSPQVTRTPI